ncbi:MAG: ABC-three component system middle component 1, partial [Pyrinomonadaceae bacterium]
MDNQEFRKSFKSTFPGVRMDMQTHHFGGELPLFFVTPKDEKWLSENWESVTDFVATSFQIHLESEYETWNIYLFFRMSAPISKELKYAIENDTWSSRKMVIETVRSIDQIIEEHIENKSLFIDEAKPAVAPFSKQ